MSLPPGARLGPYEIVSPLGAGGMGEVYKARDTRLHRAVAVKVLAAHLSASPQARQRFEREAKIVSQLSHPHICALFDVGHQDGIDFLVMELLEGEALSERLARGPLPFADVLRYGVEIADALDKAHAAGIVHRDLKPGNVMLTKSGVKLLDFGLAKAFEAAPAGHEVSGALTASAQASLTQEGAVLGTLQYMAPEQIEGKPADARSDIFALGAALYEMAAGKRPFSGETRAAIASAILSAEPKPISEVQPLTPAAFGRLVRTCLEKDPDRRWQSAHDVALQLRAIAEPELVASPAASPSGTRWLPWVLTGVATLAAVAALQQARRAPLGAGAATIRFQVQPPAGRTFIKTVEMVSQALSPDGAKLILVAREPDGETRLWLRPLSAVEAQPIVGTEGALSAFWSPDSRSIGFFARGKLKRLEFGSNGPALVLCDVRHGVGLMGSWGTAGQILFASIEGEAIFSVPSGGGTPVALLKGDDAGRVRWPSFLPDGKRFLYLTLNASNGGELMLGQAGQPSRAIRPAVSHAAYAEPGYIVIAQEGTLLGQGFDLTAGTVVGDPFPIAEPVTSFASSGWADFSVSQNGVVTYGSSRDRSRLAWVDRTGRELGRVGTAANIGRLRLSPDASKALFDRAQPETGTLDLWTLDLARNIETRLTSDPGTEIAGAWPPDQGSVFFSAARGKSPHLYRRDFASGAEEQLTPAGTMQFVEEVSPDGKLLLFEQRSERGDADIFALPLEGPRTPWPFVASVASEEGAAFSPDGRFVAFVSTESGAPEIYLRAFPGGRSNTRVSPAGGYAPHWSRDTRELFYVGGHGEIIAVSVRTSPRLDLGRPVALFTPKAPGWVSYDVAPDGSKFLAMLPEVVAIEQPLTVVANWPAEIHKP